MPLTRTFPMICLSLFLSLSAISRAETSEEKTVELLNPVSMQRQAVDALRNLSRSPFQNLKARFEKSKEPLEKDFEPRLPGRCYFSDRPMQPVAALLSFAASSDDGPAFRGLQYHKIIPFVARRAGADYLDRLTTDSLNQLKSLEKAHRDDVSYPVRSNATVRSFVPRSMTLQARSYEFRKDDKFLIMKVTCEDHGGCKSETEYDRWLYLEDEEVAYCYFFKN